MTEPDRQPGTPRRRPRLTCITSVRIYREQLQRLGDIAAQDDGLTLLVSTTDRNFDSVAEFLSASESFTDLHLTYFTAVEPARPGRLPQIGQNVAALDYRGGKLHVRADRAGDKDSDGLAAQIIEVTKAHPRRFLRFVRVNRSRIYRTGRPEHWSKRFATTVGEQIPGFVAGILSGIVSGIVLAKWLGIGD